MKNNKTTLQAKIYNNIEDFEQQLSKWKDTDQKIVFTNGCFDIMHLGHVDYLSKAADLGTKLVIGLNSDDSTKRLKGPTRPINDQQSRSCILAAFFFVDAIILFDDETPLRLINAILPNVLVKGADYEIANIVGAKEVLANNGEVKTITFIEGYSTTAIEQKIIKAQ
ncbi:D-glycero-beta-D-manno-heptose 1-phosphate adenylyltransferase [Pedobacter cryophilus]|uniref:D-glycero-beta-D-manno-heptose 1-phosphate adenylyltransferase n=1 Tax=Pedobacter cryophilus TaxID=2571271 RepID=A0A4U1CA95_9SPHI|nr:D-glycero-beta-D-manno-heptose 1-phosphate adenylyltransferase [Pedobacter cryophilus]TKC00608.1 D-glycero-beta-D-manno-heptose 1-phosphate adenylyltransferase [Pedobacter cryophilus]